MHVCVVSETGCYVCDPVVRALWAGARFCACDEGGWAPGGKAAAVGELVDEEVEEGGGVGVVDDLAAPGGVAAGGVCGMLVGGLSCGVPGIRTVAGVGVCSVIVACASCCW